MRKNQILIKNFKNQYFYLKLTDPRIWFDIMMNNVRCCECDSERHNDIPSLEATNRNEIEVKQIVHIVIFFCNLTLYSIAIVIFGWLFQFIPLLSWNWNWWYIVYSTLKSNLFVIHFHKRKKEEKKTPTILKTKAHELPSSNGLQRAK